MSLPSGQGKKTPWGSFSTCLSSTPSAPLPCSAPARSFKMRPVKGQERLEEREADVYHSQQGCPGWSTPRVRCHQGATWLACIPRCSGADSPCPLAQGPWAARPTLLTSHKSSSMPPPGCCLTLPFPVAETPAVVTLLHGGAGSLGHVRPGQKGRCSRSDVPVSPRRCPWPCCSHRLGQSAWPPSWEVVTHGCILSTHHHSDSCPAPSPGSV